MQPKLESGVHGLLVATCDFQQCGILTSVDSAKPMFFMILPHF